MEKKKSVVRSAIYQKEINGNYGVLHIFEITFDNQDKGQYLSKTRDQQKFIEGKETEYTIEEKVNGNYKNYTIKPFQENGFVPGKGNPFYEHKRVSLKCAVDLCCHGKIETKDIKSYSESFMKFLNE